MHHEARAHETLVYCAVDVAECSPFTIGRLIIREIAKSRLLAQGLCVNHEMKEQNTTFSSSIATMKMQCHQHFGAHEARSYASKIKHQLFQNPVSKCSTHCFLALMLQVTLNCCVESSCNHQLLYIIKQQLHAVLPRCKN